MKRRIENYINFIKEYKHFDLYTYKDVVEYIFYGDGEGDFEESSNLCSKQVLEKYIKQCYKQIELAEKILKEEKVC